MFYRGHKNFKKAQLGLTQKTLGNIALDDAYL